MESQRGSVGTPGEARAGQAVGPTAAGERLSLLDALRGFALTGVLLANLNSFTLYEYLDPAQRAALPTAEFDDRARLGLILLVSRKFLTLFSLLFGLGFAVQLMRAEARGADAVPLYVRRLGVLLAIGVAHATLLWWGDILRFYAVLGLALLPFRRASSRTLLVTGLALATVGWPLLGALADGVAGAWPARVPPRASAYAQTLAVFSAGGYADIVRRNPVHDALELAYFWYLPFFVFACFLLGFWAGRRRLFHEPERQRTLLRRIFVGGLALGLAGNAMNVRQPLERALVESGPLGLAVVRGLTIAGAIALGVAYATGFALLFLRPWWRRRLQALAPVGRMALTNYLAQTLVCVPIFYGFGLGVGPRYGIPGRLAAFVVLFGAQVAVSRWWLARFRFGPLEWAWRSLTYGRRQPMRAAAPP